MLTRLNIPVSKAIKAASKRLPFASLKAQQRGLEFACGSLADAYRLGAEEAQDEIVSRLQGLAALVAKAQEPKCNP